MALYPHPLSEHHPVNDTLRHDVRRLDNLREVGCLLRQGHRHQGDAVNRHDLLRIRRSDEPELGSQYSRNLSGGEDADDTLCHCDANDILQEAFQHAR